ncbi:DUF4422 domain-containing protein [Streptococcus loxodontisalivarius]|uniref:DUF4422 domain-containing protein n=1 Tax=Streptococcus loxodontisalivarius TaxID=1349415 RepID=A0ABS2PP28_9STRE|nr:DUF4422 domain-containing protein [Streptococcus loxodontisalivarius]MBM7641777.1 hypothetical protein [Streptococcus loxodontisalivarius]
MKNYIITHKEFSPVTEEIIYEPLLVGANKNHVEKYPLKDNLYEDNISDKNSSFCELTGMYWIWKHSKEDIVGISHYRRYFTKNRYLLKKHAILSQKDIVKDLKSFDVIASLRGTGEILDNNTKEYFYEKHDGIVWEECKEIIKNKFPDYLDAFEWYENQTDTYVCNMIIMKKELYDSYCEWLFSILFDLDLKIDYSKYDNYNSRMIGFVAERLQNVWIKKNNLKVKEYPIYFTEDTLWSRFTKKVNNLKQ